MDNIASSPARRKTALPILLFLFLTLLPHLSSAQWLRTEGTQVLNEADEPVILRGMGLGGWMLQEGYMLRTYGPQHEIKERIEGLVGTEVTEEFYQEWLNNHCRRIDIDSLGAWGYNSVRLAMHYNLLTLPIQEEPVAGQNTWLEDGFARIDSLVAWLKANDMWLILDMHAAPGGQGENADISDYDKDLPSLWQSEANQDKLVALWRVLAERYADEPTVAAYDIINEPNWGFQNHANDLNGCAETGNAPLWDLQERITETIREVDTQHIIVIEGNCWGNNYNGLPTLWDDNIMISYHKYWNGNGIGSIQGMLDMRSQRNVPIWLGETGENSNTWFTDAIDLLETNGVGWSWWPLKKMGGNNPLQIEITPSYQEILDYWNGNGAKPSAAEAEATLMEIADNLRLENNTYHPDVVDAMIRQPHSNETLPFKPHTISATGTTRIQATDYDLGRHTFAYLDNEFTNESGQAGGAGWNLGGGYRNDGVDIEACEDEEGNGYNVGWTEDGEWMQYTVTVEATGVYSLGLRYALNEGPAVVKMYNQGTGITGDISLDETGDYQNWATKTVEGVVLYEGTQKLRLFMEDGGANLNYFSFTYTGSTEDLPFSGTSGQTNIGGDTVTLYLNKQLATTTIPTADFSLRMDGQAVALTGASRDDAFPQRIHLTLDTLFDNRAELRLDYSGTGLLAEDGTELQAFTDLAVSNYRPVFHMVPGKIEAEAYWINEGFESEETNDQGGGLNMGFTDTGDYLEYDMAVTQTAIFTVRLRMASVDADSRLRLEQRSLEGEVLSSAVVTFGGSGDWQTWETVDGTIELTEGISRLRLVVEKPRFNLNWFGFVVADVLDLPNLKPDPLVIFPNPISAHAPLHLQWQADGPEPTTLHLSDVHGRLIHKYELDGRRNEQVHLPHIKPGMYYLTIRGQATHQVSPLVVK